MRRLSTFLLTIVYIFCGSVNLFASDEFSLNGYYKNYSFVFDQAQVKGLQETNQPIMGSVTNRLRVNLSCRPNNYLSVNLAYDFSPVIQDKSLFDEPLLGFGLKTRTYRAIDLDSRPYPQKEEKLNSFAIFQNLDRLFLTLSSKFADIYLGRQAIAWGSARVINPTDVIAPYSFNELDTEDRRGVDALRIRIPLSPLEEIDAGYIFGDDFEFKNSALFLRGKFYYRRTDLSLIMAGFQENLLAGFDLTRSIGGAGFWLEGGYVFTDALDGDNRKNDENYFRTSLGFDYSLKNGTYLFLEYHFNQAGACKSEDYLIELKGTAYQEGSVYLLGRHYLAPGISYPITPLITFSGEALLNITDPSIFLMPQFEYNIAENIYLSAGAYFGLGKSPKALISQYGDPALLLRSEFGSYPDLYFTSFRVYF
ncbi:MAG: hypothetical protein OEV55_09880 [candidate division Zixibacteria bacterium]|nr:hypothetical protein [candidate division Zixibacteria bacterium]